MIKNSVLFHNVLTIYINVYAYPISVQYLFTIEQRD